MSDSNTSRAKHNSILSSLTALGASELPVTTNSVPRNNVLASVAAAGMSLLTCQSADAGTISVFNPNVNVGFAAGDLSNFKFSIGSLTHGFKLAITTLGHVFNTIVFRETAPSQNDHVHVKRAYGYVAPASFGKNFSQIGVAATGLGIGIPLASGTPGGLSDGADFLQEYYAFSFIDGSSDTHYGWIYGTMSGTYSDLSYNLISYAYDTTPNEQIGMGFTGASATPEPSTLALDAMAALILGAAGVRKRNKSWTWPRWLTKGRGLIRAEIGTLKLNKKRFIPNKVLI